MKKEIYLAGGCFWGVERYFSLMEPVVETAVGYANGRTQNPTYEQVCRDHTGHAETVRVVYDAAQISLEELLELFYQIIDPTSINRQGGDIGEQYRTGIYYTDEGDKPVIRRSLEELERRIGAPVAIEAMPLEQFFPAEGYHQDYLVKNPGGYCHISLDAFERAKQVKGKGKVYRRKSKQELRDSLTEMQYSVTQESATEPPFQGEYHDHFEPGIYVDVTTGEPLFLSTQKFQSGCGWPSFARPIDDALLAELDDTTLGMRRTEVRSKTGDAHLGHVFDDGPQELGGLRYCINSAALRFVHQDRMEREGYGFLLPLLGR